jgi:hypothetical protein
MFHVINTVILRVNRFRSTDNLTVLDARSLCFQNTLQVKKLHQIPTKTVLIYTSSPPVAFISYKIRT